ncbi:hypothetical protein BHM03_00010436 [Ensete ventricosum]|uniref:Uncharacterized protein n=1 Tax=Ensete ventricosum TaxID=4639 RepID=A0A445MD44_ENSVE|nr:hypothetical protein BHM03_00010436 [Ensete ventricosum]
MKVKKSTGHAASRPIPLPTTEVPVEAIRECPAHGGKKHLDGGGSAPPRKKTKIKVSKTLRRVAHEGTSKKAHRGKGKRAMSDRVGKDCYFIAQISDLSRLDAEGPLNPRWLNLTNLTRVSTEGPIAGSGPEAVAAAKRWTTELDVEVEWLKVTLGESKQRHKDIELAVDFTCIELRDLRDYRCQLKDEVLSFTKGAEMLQSKLKAKADKVIIDYKKSRGFQSGMEKMGQVTYEFGYRVLLERFWAKYLDLSIEENPFVERPEDANVRMEASQPFDDSTPPEE